MRDRRDLVKIDCDCLWGSRLCCLWKERVGDGRRKERRRAKPTGVEGGVVGEGVEGAGREEETAAGAQCLESQEAQGGSSIELADLAR